MAIHNDSGVIGQLDNGNVLPRRLASARSFEITARLFMILVNPLARNFV